MTWPPGTPVDRRGFLALGTALAGGALLTGCTPAASAANPDPAGTTGADLAPLRGIEKTELTVGFIPITCASPIINAKSLGVYAKHGLNVKLKKYSGWADLWGSYVAGEIDATHMLAPMPLAIHHGYAAGKVGTRLSLITNTNGQAITLANKHFGAVREPADLRGFVLAIPFEFSVHNLLLRHYLGTGGLDPDLDVDLRVMRPADMVANLLTGNIDGYLGPDPFNQRAVTAKAGFLHVLTRDLWDGHPCCSFAVRDSFAAENPQTYRALLRAVADASLWSNEPGHRVQAAESMAAEQYLNQKPELLKAVLTGDFQDGTGRSFSVPDRVRFQPYPHESYGVWMLSQLQRWGLIPADTFGAPADYLAAVRPVFDTQAASAVLADLGAALPARGIEHIMGSVFDPANPAPWTERQVKP
jgi:nitrate/nitrite transport system substrate-binding protein